MEPSMKAVVFHGVGDIRLDDVPEPKIEQPTDAVVRITASAICGTDLHFVRGTVSGMKPGTILGHEAVGVVEEVGKDVRNFRRGDRVVIAVDTVPSRLDMARAQSAEVIDFNAEDPVEAIRRLTGGIGVDRAIDAVGVDAEAPHRGPAAGKARREAADEARQLRDNAPRQNPRGDNWHPGDAPSQVLEWAVEAVAKAGTIAIVGVYPPAQTSYP